MEEEWRAVVGWSNYSVSNLGRVRKEDDGRKTKKGILTPSEDGWYPKVNLSDGVQQETQVFVHHLVLKAFVGLCPENYLARHLDDNKCNNVLTNLKWGTQKENAADAKRNGILVGHASRSKEEQKKSFERMVATRRENGSFLGFKGIPEEKRAEALKKMSDAKIASNAKRKSLGLPIGSAGLSKEKRAEVSKKVSISLKEGHASGKYDGILFGRAAFSPEKRREQALQGAETRRRNKLKKSDQVKG